MKWVGRFAAGLIALVVIGVAAFVFLIDPPGPPPFVEKAPDPEGRPNILVLMAEDLSPRWGSFGDPMAVTPNIDALAKRGTRYPNTFTTAGVCAPSRAALITGMHQGATGTQHMRTSNRGYKAVPPESVKAFPELMRAAGYYTYTGEKLDYQFSGIRAGTGPFTIWDDEGERAHWRKRSDGQPFFALDNFEVTHESGLFAPLGHWPRSALHLAIQLYRHHLYGPIDEIDQIDPAAIPLPPIYPDVEAVRRDFARHYANIARFDTQVGETVRMLEQDGLAQNTILIITTDHGDGLPRAKRELTDAGIRVPMIVVWPDRWRPANAPPGSVDERLVSFVDLAPTLLHLGGVDVPRHMQGRDFVTGPRRQHIFAARDRVDDYVNRQRAVRGPRFKYIANDLPGSVGGHRGAFRDHLDSMRAMRDLYEAGKLDPVQARWFEPTPAEQLYDTKADPYETNNLIGDPRYAAIRRRLRSALDDWRARMGPLFDLDEDAMIKAIADDDGNQRVTPPPAIDETGGTITLTAENNASIGYRWGDGPWQLYTAPFQARPRARLEAKAVRYGWAESDVVRR